MAKNVFSDSKCKYEAYDKTEVNSKIVDSTSLTDNTAQTYSGRIIDEKIDSLPKYAVVGGTATTPTQSGEAVADIDYPEGFNKNNCYCIQAGFGSTTQFITNIYQLETSKYYIKEIALNYDKISIMVGFQVPQYTSFDVIAILVKFTD